jgi:hypothetical protein|tara:strand:- start:481 stop:714 length:234 start_codon:yes stop_codon:yes gene_type:complete
MTNNKGNAMSFTEYRPTPVSFAMGITLSFRGENYDLYQPSEGGFRVRQDGPCRSDGYGQVITHDTIEEACLHLQRLV